MIKINLLAPTQQGVARAVKQPKVRGEGNFGQSVLMSGVVVLALLFIGWRWYDLASEESRLVREIAAAEKEKERLQEIIKKGEE